MVLDRDGDTENLHTESGAVADIQQDIKEPKTQIIILPVINNWWQEKFNSFFSAHCLHSRVIQVAPQSAKVLSMPQSLEVVNVVMPGNLESTSYYPGNTRLGSKASWPHLIKTKTTDDFLGSTSSLVFWFGFCFIICSIGNLSSEVVAECGSSGAQLGSNPDHSGLILLRKKVLFHMYHLCISTMLILF